MIDSTKIKKKVDPLILRGDYSSALTLVKPALAADPKNFHLRYLYAKILGDWADELSPARKNKFKKESLSILKPLLNELRGKDVLTRWRIPLNYFYQSEDWRGMYEFGRKFSRVDRRLANYAKGLAATSLAEAHARGPWSKRAVRAWTAYDLRSEKYYFAHYVFAKALALDGQKFAAMARLRRAAKLGKRPVTDWEFADVFALCQP